MHKTSSWLYRVSTHKGAEYPLFSELKTTRMRSVTGLSVDTTWGNISVERTLLGLSVSVSPPGMYTLELFNHRGVIVISLVSLLLECGKHPVVLGDTIPGIYGFSIRGETLGHRVSGKVILV